MDTSKEILNQLQRAADVFIADVLEAAKPRFESVTLLVVPEKRGTAMERALNRMKISP